MKKLMFDKLTNWVKNVSNWLIKLSFYLKVKEDESKENLMQNLERQLLELGVTNLNYNNPDYQVEIWKDDKGLAHRKVTIKRVNVLSPVVDTEEKLND